MPENHFFSTTKNHGLEKTTKTCFYYGQLRRRRSVELVGLFILKHLGEKFGKENIRLYRDNGLAIVKNKSARLADKTRKELHKIFEQFALNPMSTTVAHVCNNFRLVWMI